MQAVLLEMSMKLFDLVFLTVFVYRKTELFRNIKEKFGARSHIDHSPARSNRSIILQHTHTHFSRDLILALGSFSTYQT